MAREVGRYSEYSPLVVASEASSDNGRMGASVCLPNGHHDRDADQLTESIMVWKTTCFCDMLQEIIAGWAVLAMPVVHRGFTSGCYYLLPIPATCYLLPTTYHLPPTVYYLLPATCHLLPTAYCLLPPTYCRQPTTNLLPTTCYLRVVPTYYMLLSTTTTYYYYYYCCCYYYYYDDDDDYYYAGVGASTDRQQAPVFDRDRGCGV